MKDDDDDDGDQDCNKADAETEQPVVGDGHVAMDGGEQGTPGNQVHDLDGHHLNQSESHRNRYSSHAPVETRQEDWNTEYGIPEQYPRAEVIRRR